MSRLGNTYNMKLVHLLCQNISNFKYLKVKKHIYKSFINLNNSNQLY
jgi:hypothetical protein